MKRYYICLIIVTLILVIASFITMWVAPESFIIAMPVFALYFAIVTGIEHYLIVKSAQKDPRTFVRNFLGITIGQMMLHLIILTISMFRNTQQAKLIAVAFLIGFATFLVFETTALILFVKKAQNQ